MSEEKIRHRKAYGDTFRKLISELYGLGIEPGSLKMERNFEDHPTDKLPRARFDIIQTKGDEEYILFEAKTSDELNLVAEGIEQAKQIFSFYLKEKGIATTDVLMHLFEAPNVTSVKLSVQGSFDEDFAKLIVPEAVANQNQRMQRAASTQSYGGKNPKRVEAGRRAAAKRWGGDTDTTAH